MFITAIAITVTVWLCYIEENYVFDVEVAKAQHEQAHNDLYTIWESGGENEDDEENK